MKVNNIFSKLCLLFMMVLGGASVVSAQEENPIKLSVDPLVFTPGTETVVTVSYETSVSQNAFSLDFILPKGLTVVDQEIVDEDGENVTVPFLRGNALLAGHNFLYNYLKEKDVYKFLVGHPKLKFMKDSGTLFSFKVKVSDELADDAKISFKSVCFTENAPVFNQDFPIKKVSVNDAAFAEISDSIHAGQKYLEEAAAKVKEQCPDVAADFIPSLNEVSEKMVKYEKAIVAKHEANNLTTADVEAVKNDLKVWKAEADEIVTKALKAQNDVTTGIHGINADFQNAEAVYSIGGVRLNKAAKGVNVVIRNGKAIKVVK